MTNLAPDDACCTTLFDMLREAKLPIEYDARWHVIRMVSLTQDWTQDMSFCPFCGSAWVSALEDKWWAEIEALGIDGDNFADILNRVPEKFRTAAWWKEKSD